VSQEFDIANFSAVRTAERIREFRSHLRDELLPGSRGHAQSTFLVPFVEYLDRQAERFEAYLDGPMDLLALVGRSLLEFFLLLNNVFTNQETRQLFVGEMYLDAEEIRTRIEKMGIPGHLLQTEPPEWDAIPNKRVLVMKDKFDDYFFKLCSKCVHPTALSILAPESLSGRFIFYYFALNYLARSYNFLVDRVFHEIDP